MPRKPKRPIPFYESDPKRAAYYRRFGKRVLKLREVAGLTQTQLGAKVGFITHGSVANIEAGRQQVLIHTAIALAKALRVTVATLMGLNTGA